VTEQRTARFAGLTYLGLAIAGLVGFVLIRSQLFEPGDAAATAANLVAHEGLARLGIVADLSIVVTQALAALYFYKLFRGVNSFAAGSLAAFGFVSSVVILVATAFSATALEVVIRDGAAAAANTSLLLYDLNDAAWSVGALFLGLWLIPMGWLALRSGVMPRLLGWILIAGGVGYTLSPYVAFLSPSASTLADALTVPASVGEFWMIGYLLFRGVDPDAPGPEASSA